MLAAETKPPPASTESLSLLYSRRDRERRTLRNDLSKINIVDLSQMIWCICAISDNRDDLSRKFGYRFRPIYNSPAERTLIYPKWNFETIFNEYLSYRYPLAQNYYTLPDSKLDVSDINLAEKLHKNLRRLEDSEEAIWLRDHSVLNMMAKIGYRQLPWQRRFDVLGDLFRSCFVYGFPEADASFRDQTGFSLEALVKAGFAFWSSSKERPFFSGNVDLKDIGISHEERDLILAYLSLSEKEMIDFSRKIRTNDTFLTPDKPSVLRSKPLIHIVQNNTYISPIPDLLFSRISTGLFYDIVGKPGNISRIYGKKYEMYVELLLKKYLGAASIRTEYEYYLGKRQFDSPDFFIVDNSKASIIIECKSKKAKHLFRTADDPADFESDLKEISYGVFQIWRHIFHSRQNIANDIAIDKDVIGVVITLDTWLDMSKNGISIVFEQAKEMAESETPPVPIDCQCPVVVISENDLEDTLAQSTPATFNSAIHNLALKEHYLGWRLSHVHADEPGIQPPMPAGKFVEGLPVPHTLNWFEALGD